MRYTIKSNYCRVNIIFVRSFLYFIDMIDEHSLHPLPSLEELRKQYIHTPEDLSFEYNAFNMTQFCHNPMIYLSSRGGLQDEKIEIEHKFLNMTTTINTKTGENETQQIFIKYSPLLDPIRYMTGKYKGDIRKINLATLLLRASPEENAVTVSPKSNDIYEKIKDRNNASYVDGFFIYLTNKLLENHGVLHGIRYFGSYLAIQDKYKMNVEDDIDCLYNSTYFMKNINKYFAITDNDNVHYIGRNSRINKRGVLKICDEDIAFDIEELNINTDNQAPFENTDTDTEVQNPENDNTDTFIDTLEHIEILYEKHNIDETSESKENSDNDDDNDSETEYTDDDANHDDISTAAVEDEIEEELNNNNPDDNSDNAKDTILDEELDESSDSNSDGSDSNSDGSDSNNTDENIGEGEDITSEYDDADDVNSSDADDASATETETEADHEVDINVYAYMYNFPVQVICQEKCTGTLDSLFANKLFKTTDEERSALFQVIMTLLIYQKVFQFTHNDLHTNNIMYTSTEIEYIYYKYENKTYKVPTFGRIFKIIDFGRAIYKYKGEIFCSDSFAKNGDAVTQYNCEPFLNESKPRLDPNPSFDLCRLGCSIYDFIIDDFPNAALRETLGETQQLIYDWCSDDNGKNVLYKSDGDERYPDFKLYKMIARTVHNHTPAAQLERPYFKVYETIDIIDNNSNIINIDAIVKTQQ